MVAVYTAADLADLKPIKPMMPNLNAAMTQTLLASDTVRYVGEPVAVVVTEEPYQGEDAVELVAVDYDPLPAVVDHGRRAGRQDACCSPSAGTNVVGTLRRASRAGPETCSTAARSWSAGRS